MKKALSLLILCVIMFSLCSCGTEGVPSPGTQTNPGSVENTDATPDSSEKKDPAVTVEKNKMPTEMTNMFLVCEQTRDQVVVYDMESYNGENLEDNVVWSFRPTGNEGKTANSMSGAKFRTGTVFGDVVLMCASGGYASMVTYPEKKVIWQVAKSGTNPHSIEILPDGNLVVASSTGATVRLYHTAELLQDPDAAVSTGVDYELKGAHGVLWDPKYQCLWAVGDDELVAYTLSGTGKSLQLVLDETRGRKLPAGGGHDLSADFSDPDHLWVTVNSKVLHFNKAQNAFEKDFENSVFLSRPAVKGFGNNLNGHFFYCYPNGGPGRAWNKKSIAEWCTDTISYAYYNESGQMRWTACVSKKYAYYKVVSFYGEYQ